VTKLYKHKPWSSELVKPIGNKGRALLANLYRNFFLVRSILALDATHRMKDGKTEQFIIPKSGGFAYLPGRDYLALLYCGMVSGPGVFIGERR
jgi:hypothetical protein